MNIYFCAFVFFATVCSYNFHWYLTPHSVNSSTRLKWATEHKGYHLILYFIGLAGAAVFFFFLWRHWLWLLLAAVITFLYSAPKLPQRIFRFLKTIAIGKTLFLTMVWTYVTAVLPVLIEGRQWQMPTLYFILGRFLLIYAICILFDYRDREDDKADGIRSMITYLNERGINSLFMGSLILFCVFTLLLWRYDYSILHVGIILIPGIIVAALYNYARRSSSDYFYYFVLDGLMMFSALLMLILQI